MSTRRSIDPDRARYWLSHARNRLGIAKEYNPTNPALAERCESAHTAAEIALKGLITAHGAEYPDTHNLEKLFNTLQRLGENISPQLRKAQRLTAYAGKRRYRQLEHQQAQGPPAEVRKSDYDQAVRAAEYVLDWSKERIRARLAQRHGSENLPADTPRPHRGGVPDRARFERRPNQASHQTDPDRDDDRSGGGPAR